MSYSDKPDTPGDLLHNGVKGMKWGVRKDRGHEGERAKTKKIAKLDKKFESNAKTINAHFALHNRAAQLTNDHDVDRINNKPQYKNVDFTKDSPLRQKYYKEHENAFIKNLNRAANEAGTNASGTKKYKIDMSPDGDWGISVVQVKHADTPNEDDSFVVKVIYDDKGRIIGLKMPDDALTHFGVKGMHWGVRKAVKPMHADYSRSSQAYDRKNFGKGAVNRINDRLHGGADLKMARKAEYKRRKQVRRRVVIAGAAFKHRRQIVAGAKFAASVVALVGGVAAQHIAVKAEANRGRAAAADLMGIASKGSTINYSDKRRGAYNITSL